MSEEEGEAPLGGDIFTGIDALVKYLNEHGETESVVAAGALAVSERTVEDWAKILEKANIVRISYKLGKMYVALTSGSKAGEKEVKQTVDIKKTILEGELLNQMNIMEKINERLDEFNKFVSGTETLFKSKAGNIKDAVDRIDRFQAEVTDNFNNMKEKKERIDNFAQSIEKEFGSLRSRAEGIESFGVDTENVKSIVDDMKTRTGTMVYEVRELLKRYDAEVKEERGRILGLSESVKKESKMLRELAAEGERELIEYGRRIGEYKKNASAVIKKAEKDRIVLLDEVAKTEGEVDRLYSAAGNEVVRLNADLEKARKEYGGFAELNDKLKEIRKLITDMSREKEEVEGEINEFSKDLKALETVDSKNVVKGVGAVDRLKKKSSRTSKRLDKAIEGTSRLRKKIEDLGK